MRSMYRSFNPVTSEYAIKLKVWFLWDQLLNHRDIMIFQHLKEDKYYGHATMSRGSILPYETRIIYLIA